MRKLQNGFLFTLVFLIQLQAYSQHSTKRLNKEDSIINKWIKACINFEVQPNFFMSRRFQELVKQSQREGDKFDKSESMRIQDSAFHSRFTCTGVYFKRNGKSYLITARHCLEDTSGYNKPDVFERLYLVENASKSLELGALPNTSRPYIVLTTHKPLNEVSVLFSSVDADLAVLCLDASYLGKDFIKALNYYGYEPITEKDIYIKDYVQNNEPLFAFGFPEMSERGRVYMDATPFSRVAISYTIPVVSKGYLDSFKSGDKYFIGNIFIYHGFSGGPVVQSGKLIGINSSYVGYWHITDSKQLKYYFSERSRFGKASLIPSLINELERRINTKVTTSDSTSKKG